MRQVAAALEGHELAAGRLRERGALRVRPNRVGVAVDDEHRAAHTRAPLGERDAARQLHPAVRVDERLRRRLEPPAHAVLGLLRGVRLREALREEEFEEAAVIAQPVVDVVLGPVLLGVERFIERVDAALGKRRGERNGRGDERCAGDALGVLVRELHAPHRAARDADQDGALCLRRVEHGKRVERELAHLVRFRPGRSVGPPAAAPVERHDPTVARQVGDLHLPVARVDDRPGRQEQDGRLPLPVDLVEDPDAVALDVTLLIRVARPCLLLRRQAFRRNGHRDLLSSQASIHSRSSSCPSVTPERRSSMMPSLNVMTSETSTSSGISIPYRSRGSANASIRTARHSAFTWSTRSCSSGRFQASAWSSSQTFSYADVVADEVAHRRPPLLDEGHVGGVHLALTRDLALGKALEHAHEQLLDRAEVVVDEAVVRPGLLRHPARRDPSCAHLEEQPLRGVEERLLRFVSGANSDLVHLTNTFD